MTAARAATDQLTLALLNMAARGERTHCSDPTSHQLWLSEHEQERAVAVMLCDPASLVANSSRLVPDEPETSSPRFPL
jgi:hypothetical protein